MKHLIHRILGALALTAGALTAPAAFAGDVGVSISVGQPGFYGRIDVGNTRPDVIYAQPMVIERVYDPAPPLYLRVPPDHYRYWARHCGYYRACGRRCTSSARTGTRGPMRRCTTAARTCTRCRCMRRRRLRAGIRRAATTGMAAGTAAATGMRTAAAGTAGAGKSAATTIAAGIAAATVAATVAAGTAVIVATAETVAMDMVITATEPIGARV